MITAIACALAAVLGVWGAQRLWVVCRAVIETRGASALPESPAELPFVTVQIPLYNEPDVGPRVVAAALALDWPQDRFEVQVLDDSDDDTPSRIPPGALHIRRTSRAGYKAGALANGLQTARGEYIAIFDADFVPPRQFLREAIARMKDVDVLQFRWGHENRGASSFTRAQAALLDAHFSVEQRGRAVMKRFFPFNGTAGVWRRSAIERAGGWSSSTLTEDLDLSVRAWRAGCRFAYVDELAVPAELPADVDAWRIQQHRWAKGGAQTFRRHAPELVRAGELDALLRVGQSLAFLPLFALLIVLPLAALEGASAWLSLAWIPFVASLIASSRSGPLDWIAAMALGAATAPTAALAVVEGLLGLRGNAFARTPKRKRASARSMLWLVEIPLGVIHLGVAIATLQPSLALCGLGLLYVGGSSAGHVVFARLRGASPRTTF